MPGAKGPSPGPPASASRLLVAAILLLATLPAVSAQDSRDERDGATGDSFFFRIEDVRRYFAWGWDFLPTGIDVTVGCKLPQWFAGMDTILQAGFGGGYEGFGTFRTFDYRPNSPVIPPEVAADPDGNLEFNSPNFQWQAGIRQGILWNQELNHNLLEAFLYYRGRYDRYLEGRHYWGSDETRIAAIESTHEAWQASYLGSDAHGIFGTSLFAGLAYDALRFETRSKAYDGTYAEASLEISPYFPSVLGASDFWRLNFSTKSFRILYQDRPQAEKNRLAIYAGSYLSIDYSDASRQMPLYVMQSFGGTEVRKGLAHAVRGFEDYSWDTQLKIVHNFDLRFNLPVIYSIRGRDLLPGLVVYFDLGYGTRYWGDPQDTPGGFLGSIGLGAYLGLLDLLYAQLYCHFPLIGRRIDGAPFALDLDIGLHF